MSKRSVFISHSKRDAAVARQLANNLRRLGLTALNSADTLQPGDDWRKTTQTAIKQSDALILIASPDALSSSWALYETGAAEALGKRVMVLLPERHSVAELPGEISGSQVVGFDPRSPERAAHDIATLLAAA
jgi:hypothetical protein